MGRAYTTRGVAINFGGTSAPTFPHEVILANGTNEAVINLSGTNLSIDNNSNSADASIGIECLSGNVTIAANGGTMKFFIDSDAGNVFLFLKGAGAGGTIAELDKDGNLRIAGTLGTGVTF